MKKHLSKLLIVMMLAVLFVPLFSNIVLASTPYIQDWFSYPSSPAQEEDYVYQFIISRDGILYDQLYISNGDLWIIGDTVYTKGNYIKRYQYEDSWKLIGNSTSNVTLGNNHLSEYIVESNCTIYGDSNLQTIHKAKTIDKTIDFEKGFDEDGYGIRFLLPRNGFKDNSYLFTYYIEYRFPPFLRNLSIRVDGDYIEGTGTQENLYSELEADNSVNGTIKFTVGHEIGLNTIRAYAKYPDGTEFGYEAYRQIERLGGFIDEDGDGKDDRTGREDNNQEMPWYHDDYNPDGNRPNRDEYGDDIIGTLSYYFDTLLYWLLSPFRLIAEGLQSTLSIVTDTFGWAGNFATMIGGLFSFLPAEITGMITLAFTSLIVFTIIKVVRK